MSTCLRHQSATPPDSSSMPEAGGRAGYGILHVIGRDQQVRCTFAPAPQQLVRTIHRHTRVKPPEDTMVLELHVWGPAFSLPSIDAQCLATIAYLSLALPKDAWVLVASSDPSLSPTSESSGLPPRRQRFREDFTNTLLVANR